MSWHPSEFEASDEDIWDEDIWEDDNWVDDIWEDDMKGEDVSDKEGFCFNSCRLKHWWGMVGDGGVLRMMRFGDGIGNEDEEDEFGDEMRKEDEFGEETRNEEFGLSDREDGGVNRLRRWLA